MMKRLFAIAAVAMLLGAAYPVLAGAHADAPQHRGFAGSWLVQITADGGVVPPIQNLTTNTPDGLVVNTDPALGTGHGSWKRQDRRRASVSFVTLIPPDNTDFPPGTWVTVSGQMQLATDGATASGRFRSVFEHPVLGELFSFEGTVEFERLAPAP